MSSPPILSEGNLHRVPADVTSTTLLEAHWWPHFYPTHAIFPLLPSTLPEPPRQERLPLTRTPTGRGAPRSLSATMGIGSPSELHPLRKTPDSFSYILTSEFSFLQQKESSVSFLTTAEARAVLFQGLGNIFQRWKPQEQKEAPPPFPI